MKLLIVTALPSLYLQQYYQSVPAREETTYADHWRSLAGDKYGWADNWAHALAPYDYEVCHVVRNFEPMLRAWEKENMVVSDRLSRSKDDIVVAMINKCAPEILWFNDYDRDLLRRIRSEVPTIRIVLGAVGSALPENIILHEMDLVFSCAPESVALLRQKGVNVELLHHAFTPTEIGQTNQRSSKSIDFSFVGQIIHGEQYHYERERLLKYLVSTVGLEILSPSAHMTWHDDLKIYLLAGGYYGVSLLKKVGIPTSLLEKLPGIARLAQLSSQPVLPICKELKSVIRPALYGKALYKYIQSTRVNLNVHADSSPEYASNMRLFEVTGLGSCLLTDWRKNLPELFTPDEEVVVYNSPAECAEKARWLLAHPNECEKIASAGYQRVLNEHLYMHRAPLVDSCIRRQLQL